MADIIDVYVDGYDQYIIIDGKKTKLTPELASWLEYLERKSDPKWKELDKTVNDIFKRGKSLKNRHFETSKVDLDDYIPPSPSENEYKLYPVEENVSGKDIIEKIKKFFQNQIFVNRPEETYTHYNSLNDSGDNFLFPGEGDGDVQIPFESSVLIYIDYSGSWRNDAYTDYANKIIGMIKGLNATGMCDIKAEILYFSEAVSPTRSALEYRGCNAGEIIIKDMISRNPDNIIIFTDNGINDDMIDYPERGPRADKMKSKCAIDGGVWMVFVGGRSDDLPKHLRGKLGTWRFDIDDYYSL